MPTLMWGERGLVATFFLDLATDIERWRAFLQNVWPLPPVENLDWTHVDDVWAVVEPNLGNRGFGQPDAAFRLILADKRRIVVLLEAKLGLYLESCWLPVMRGQDGFNSKLNGQLELNHCFTLALAEYQPGHHQLIDPEWILQTPYVAARPQCHRRRLKNPIVRQQLVDPLINDGVHHYLHIILTSDPNNPLTIPGHQPWFPEIFVDAQQGNVWGGHANRFGWANWATLRNLALGWNDPHARFLQNLNFNFPHQADDDEPLAGVAQGVPPGWPPDRPSRGVSLIYAPTINNHTFLHFSWRLNSCCLRDFTQHPPLLPEAHTTLQVLGLKMHEEPCGPGRPPIIKVAAWQQIINGANNRYAL